ADHVVGMITGAVRATGPVIGAGRRREGVGVSRAGNDDGAIVVQSNRVAELIATAAEIGGVDEARRPGPCWVELGHKGHPVAVKVSLVGVSGGGEAGRRLPGDIDHALVVYRNAVAHAVADAAIVVAAAKKAGVEELFAGGVHD